MQTQHEKITQKFRCRKCPLVTSGKREFILHLDYKEHFPAKLGFMKPKVIEEPYPDHAYASKKVSEAIVLPSSPEHAIETLQKVSHERCDGMLTDTITNVVFIEQDNDSNKETNILEENTVELNSIIKMTLKKI